MGYVFRFIIYLIPFLKEIIFAGRDEDDYSILDKLKKKLVLFTFVAMMIYGAYVSQRLFAISSRIYYLEKTSAEKQLKINELTKNNIICDNDLKRNEELLLLIKKKRAVK